VSKTSFLYTKENTKEISFPLGGIGTGSIGLAGNGRLIDWEIRNRPDKGSVNKYSHFAVKVEKDNQVIDARVLNGDLHPPYSGQLGEPHFGSFGFGPSRAWLSGVPHFRDAVFEGKFPISRLNFLDDTFPGRVSLTAFNPFIPMNDKDSSIPGAFFEIAVENTEKDQLNYTLVFCAGNMNQGPSAFNRHFEKGPVQGILMGMDEEQKEEVHYGNLAIASDMEDVSYQEYWYRGSWFDDLEVYWNDLNKPGKFQNRKYDKEVHGNNTGTDMCTLAVHFTLAPGESRKARFILTWYYPNCTNYWSPKKENTCCCKDGCCDTNQWKNYYASLFQDSLDCAVYSLTHWDSLYRDTLSFQKALFSSTLPEAVLDAVSANISILKSPTCLRLEDGSFYGFEGCHCDSGCCEGSCTHVWNYAYALPFLFPNLERSMRELDYQYNMDENGGMAFRLQLPLGSPRSRFRPCADGQFGGVLKVYREWKISGDDQWLKQLWPSVKKSIEYAWSDQNEDRWDPGRTGVLTGRQHHTLDMEVFGPNSWLTGFYLAALKAGSEIAEYLGDKETAEQFRNIFRKGRKWADKYLFNGEYYYHRIDLKDRSVLEQFDKGKPDTLNGTTALRAYWNEEKKEIKYQIGEGCLIDQVLAQWHANLIGLGDIFDPDQVHKAVSSLYKYNFKKRMRDVFNPCRIFSLNDEAGMIICSYPDTAVKPIVSVPYAQETMNGFEYQAACHLIREGFVSEGLEVVEGIRSRYDGERRNPWNEFECGSNYARSMASYALLLTYSGFSFDMRRNMISFNPIVEGDFRVFWALHSGWGTFERTKEQAALRSLYGNIELAAIKLPFLAHRSVDAVRLNGISLDYSVQDGEIQFAKSVTIERDSVLVIQLRR
jgi:uncharacterized protein (DUF608 family)